ncbi:MAG: hypothetical protein L3J56_03800 [Bacteroidales bacterium]|nr:hypothetical protein [Bacteroidales bacterium]
MKITTHIKSIILLLLTILLGAHPTHAKTEVILTQKQVVFTVMQNQNISPLKKVVQPNVGFLKEKSKFIAVQGSSTQNTCNYTERSSGVLAEGVGVFKVDNALKLADEAAGLLVNGKYLKNPTAKNVTELIKKPFRYNEIKSKFR